MFKHDRVMGTQRQDTNQYVQKMVTMTQQKPVMIYNWLCSSVLAERVK